MATDEEKAQAMRRVLDEFSSKVEPHMSKEVGYALLVFPRGCADRPQDTPTFMAVGSQADMLDVARRFLSTIATAIAASEGGGGEGGGNNPSIH